MIAYTDNFCAWELTGWIGSYNSQNHMLFTESLRRGDYPVTADHLEQITNADADAEFEFGLDVLIDGLEQQLARV